MGCLRQIRVAKEYRAAPELLAALRAVEWVEEAPSGEMGFYCPSCRAEKREGHYDDCQLAQALARASGEEVEG